MEDFLDKAKKKGEFMARVAVIAGDVECVIRVYDCKMPFPSKSYIEKMIGRYEAEVFSEKKFKHIKVYGSVLEMMINNGKLLDANRDGLKKARAELLIYSHHTKDR